MAKNENDKNIVQPEAQNESEATIETEVKKDKPLAGLKVRSAVKAGLAGCTPCHRP